jgi:hypothetical protein
VKLVIVSILLLLSLSIVSSFGCVKLLNLYHYNNKNITVQKTVIFRENRTFYSMRFNRLIYTVISYIGYPVTQIRLLIGRNRELPLNDPHVIVFISDLNRLARDNKYVFAETDNLISGSINYLYIDSEGCLRYEFSISQEKRLTSR